MAEFASALADFNARLTTFEAGINSKIDSQVTSYLDRNGIWNGLQLNLDPSRDCVGAKSNDGAWKWEILTKSIGDIFVVDTIGTGSVQQEDRGYVLIKDINCPSRLAFRATKSGLCYFPMVSRWIDTYYADPINGYSNQLWPYVCGWNDNTITYEKLLTYAKYTGNLSGGYGATAATNSSVTKGNYMDTWNLTVELRDSSDFAIAVQRCFDCPAYAFNNYLSGQCAAMYMAPMQTILMFFVTSGENYYLKPTFGTSGRYSDSILLTRGTGIGVRVAVMAIATTGGQIY